MAASNPLGSRGTSSGARTRRACLKAAVRSGKNITANWHTTRSKLASGKSSRTASATAQRTRPASARDAARASISGLRSVASMAEPGSEARSARVSALNAGVGAMQKP